MPTTSAKITKSFFRCPVLKVAPDLLGKVLVRKIKNRVVEGIITEIEAYDGSEDLACHGRFGKTERTAVMFGPGGYFYVYLCYGIHWMLNVVTGDEGYPAAVLIRGVNINDENLDGPGKVTKTFGITGTLSGKEIDERTGLWIEDRGIVVPPSGITKTPRIGVDYAGTWAKKPYRFVAGNFT